MNYEMEIKGTEYDSLIPKGTPYLFVDYDEHFGSMAKGGEINYAIETLDLRDELKDLGDGDFVEFEETQSRMIGNEPQKDKDRALYFTFKERLEDYHGKNYAKGGTTKKKCAICRADFTPVDKTAETRTLCKTCREEMGGYAKGGKIIDNKGPVKKDETDVDVAYSVKIWGDPSKDPTEPPYENPDDRWVGREETYSDAMKLLNENHKELKEGESITIYAESKYAGEDEDKFYDEIRDEVRYVKVGPRDKDYAKGGYTANVEEASFKIDKWLMIDERDEETMNIWFDAIDDGDHEQIKIMIEDFADDDRLAFYGIKTDKDIEELARYFTRERKYKKGGKLEKEAGKLGSITSAPEFHEARNKEYDRRIDMGIIKKDTDENWVNFEEEYWNELVNKGIIDPDNYYAKGGATDEVRDYLLEVAATSDGEGLLQIAMSLEVRYNYGDYDADDEDDQEELYDKVEKAIKEASKSQLDAAHSMLEEEYSKGGTAKWMKKKKKTDVIRKQLITDNVYELGTLAFDMDKFEDYDLAKHGYNSVRAGSYGNNIGYGEADHFVKGDDGWYDEELGAYISNDQKVALMYSDYDSDGYDVAVIEYLEPLKEIKIKK